MLHAYIGVLTATDLAAILGKVGLGEASSKAGIRGYFDVPVV
jgi:hypothetical protein